MRDWTCQGPEEELTGKAYVYCKSLNAKSFIKKRFEVLLTVIDKHLSEGSSIHYQVQT